jgi:hypothetical protein
LLAFPQSQYHVLPRQASSVWVIACAPDDGTDGVPLSEAIADTELPGAFASGEGKVCEQNLEAKLEAVLRDVGRET